MIDTDGWPFEGERPADWDRAGEISRVAMLLARQQALMQLCRQRHDAVDRRKVTLRAELTESLIRMSGQLTVMRAVEERPDRPWPRWLPRCAPGTRCTPRRQHDRPHQ